MTRLILSLVVATVVPSLVRAQTDGTIAMPWEPLRAAMLARFDGPPVAQRAEPFKLFENVYYVGLETVASYLIPGKAGLVLIDATYADTADLVLDNVRQLGHDPAQIKYIVVTHGHADHAGGAARIQQATGARVMMALADWDSLGGRLTRDLVINDGDRLTLGEIELWFYLIGGHTAGNVATEIHGLVNGREFRTVIGVTFAPAPGMTAAAVKSIERLKELGP